MKYCRFQQNGAEVYGLVEPVEVEGVVHEGVGELERLKHLEDDRFAAIYNIDGVSWVYEASFDEGSRRLSLAPAAPRAWAMLSLATSTSLLLRTRPVAPW